MAIKVSGTEVISGSRQLSNITSIDATTQSTFESSLDLNNRAVGTVTGNATLDLSTGTIFEHTPTDNTTFVFSNAPASGTGYSFDLKVTGAEIGGPYDLTAAAPAFDSPGRFDTSAQDQAPQGIFFKSDGTKMFFIGSGSDTIYEYDLSPAWDISSPSYSGVSFSLASQDTAPIGLAFKDDGTKFYITGWDQDSVYEYSLSSAWDISSASYSQSFSVTAQDVQPMEVFFKPDGTKMFVLGYYTDSVYEYSLSSAWDISTASYSGVSFSVSAQESGPKGIFFKSDGTKMYISGITEDIHEYSLSVAWDISSASYVQEFDVALQTASATKLFFKPDGTKFYLSTGNEGFVLSYSISSAWDVSSASWNAPTTGYFNVSAQELYPRGLFFKPDGLKMYVVGSSGDEVNEYNLSSAWDITTASYVQNLSINGQESASTGVFFKPDGTKMYVIGTSGDDVNEYNLSSAWSISSATYLQNFSVAAQNTTPQDLFFKPDGTKMYVMGFASDEVYEYSLSSAWDISTASYSNNAFNVTAQATSPTGLSFNSDGTKMFVVGYAADSVHEYDLSSAWDISTASYSGVSFSIAANSEDFPGSIFFKSDGTSMYILGNTTDAIYEYSTGILPSLATFSYPASVSWLDASAPTDPAVGEVLSLQFFTTDGGTTYYGSRNGAVAELSTQTATTTSTTQTAIASYSTASYDAVKVVITVDDGTDRTTTEMVVTWKGTTAYSTEYATVNTGAAALATFDADVSGSNFRILATPAASTSTSFTVKAITV